MGVEASYFRNCGYYCGFILGFCLLQVEEGFVAIYPGCLQKQEVWWPHRAFSRCVWFCGFVPSLIDTTVAKMIGEAPTKPQRQSKPRKVKRYWHFRATIGFKNLRKLFVWAQTFWNLELLRRRCQHLKAARGVSSLPWLSQNGVKQCFVKVLLVLWFRQF